MKTLKERRQALRDSIDYHGPEHFDLLMAASGKNLFVKDGQLDLSRLVEGAEPWTLCLLSHAGALRLFNDCPMETMLPGFTWDPTYWVRTTVGDWNMGYAYGERTNAGMDRRLAQFWTCLEYLDQLIKQDP